MLLDKQLFSPEIVTRNRMSSVFTCKADVPEEVLFGPMPSEFHYLQCLHSASEIHISCGTSAGRMAADKFPFLRVTVTSFPPWV